MNAGCQCARKTCGRNRAGSEPRAKRVIVWTKPAQRPSWMDEETCAEISERLELRELRYAVVEKVRRTKMITVVTTLTDAGEYSKEDIADLYGFR